MLLEWLDLRYPAEALSSRDAKTLSFLAFPDSNLTRAGTDDISCNKRVCMLRVNEELTSGIFDYLHSALETRVRNAIERSESMYDSAHYYLLRGSAPLGVVVEVGRHSPHPRSL